MQHTTLAALAVLSTSLAGCVFVTGGGTEDSSASASVSVGEGSDTTAAPGATTSTSDGTTAAPTGTSAATPTETSATSTGDDSSTAADTTAATTGAGACGWVAADHVYACGGVGEDPEGIVPIDCPAPPVAGTACDGDQGPIADPGCCSDGVNAYCYLGELVVVVCE